MEPPSVSFEQAARDAGVSKGAIIARNKRWFEHLYIDRKDEPIEPNTKPIFEVGKAYSFTYDAKYADKLEFWDVIPHLSICIGYVDNAKSGQNP